MVLLKNEHKRFTGTVRMPVILKPSGIKVLIRTDANTSVKKFLLSFLTQKTGVNIL